MSLNRHSHKSACNLVLDESFEQRQWLKKRGKNNRLLFSDKMISKLQSYFKSLDDDGNNMISCSELEDPLILFGLCKNRKEVDDIFSCKLLAI
jgi:Ca2+-binding EF-hand superfamily protein